MMLRRMVFFCAVAIALFASTKIVEAIGDGNEPASARPEAIPGENHRPPTLAMTRNVYVGPAKADETNTADSSDKEASDKEATDEQTPDEPPQAAPLSPRMLALKNRVGRTLGIYEQRRQNTRDNTPWQVMHGLIGFGCDTQIHRGGPGGPLVNAIGWLCWNGSCNGRRLLYLDGDGVGVSQGYTVQGHYGQFLAMLAQSRVRASYGVRVGGKEFTVADLVEHEKLGCQPRSELTFQLISLMHYLDSDATWKNRSGQEWSIERLIKEEIEQPIRGATCGGTHRLYGLTYAVRKRQQRNEPITGQFKRAQKYIDDYHRYTWSLQNSDGSFSTAFFRYREARADLNQRLRTTGHILEWLVYSLPKEQLDEPRVVKAVEYLSGIMLQNPNRSWEIGPLGHATHALVTYYDRRFKDRTLRNVPPEKSGLDAGPLNRDVTQRKDLKTAMLPKTPRPEAEPRSFGPALRQP